MVNYVMETVDNIVLSIERVVEEIMYNFIEIFRLLLVKYDQRMISFYVFQK